MNPNPFDVFLTSEAQSDIARLGSPVQARILNRLAWLGIHAAIIAHQPLKGDEWAGCFRYRVGDHRIIYQLDRSAERLTVLKVGHRSEIYR